MKLRTRSIFLLALTILLPIAAFSADRVALVIGINDYPEDGKLPDLRNCVNDARLMEKTLTTVGFKVTLVEDANLSELDYALTKFENQIKTGDTALVYFAGHGIEFGGNNYLMAGNAKLKARSRLSDEAMKAEIFASAMLLAGAKSSFLFLDCCREMPTDTEWLTRGQRKAGLAEITIAGDIIIGLAAAPGKPALDGDESGNNSPYALALAKWIPSGLKQGDVFEKVRKEVHQMTGGMQRTWENGSFLDPFYFAKGDAVKPGVGNGTTTELAAMKAEIARMKKLAEANKMKRSTPNEPLPVSGSGGFSAYAKFAGSRGGESKRNNLGMSLQWCPPGEFWMGSSENEDGRHHDETRHRVKLSKGFWIGRTEVTQGEWQSVMGHSLLDQARIAIQSDEILHWADGKKGTYRASNNLSKDADPQSRVGDEHSDIPIYMVSWDDAMEFCKKLTAREQSADRLPSGWKYTLPSAAQWEYACRAGTYSAIYTGKLTIKGKNNGPELDGIAWYGGNSSVDFKGRGWDTDSWKEKQYSGGKAFVRKVGVKKGNAWGIHDIIGNLWEWTGDWYGGYTSSFETDPRGPTSGIYRVSRGGSWSRDARDCRAANRGRFKPGHRGDYLGFRVAVSSSK